MVDGWDEELEKLWQSHRVDPTGSTEGILEWSEASGSETMEDDPDDAVIDYITSAAQKKAREVAGNFSFALGENLLEILRERCTTILLEVARRTLLAVLFQHDERKLKFIRTPRTTVSP